MVFVLKSNGFVLESSNICHSMYFVIVSTIQVHGDRGHGYFVPAPESKDLAGCLD